MGCTRFQIILEKGGRGRAIEWIGAQLKVWKSYTGVPGVTLSITADRIAKLAELCNEALAAEQVPKVQLRRLAGLATWIAGVMPQMSAFTSMIWTATATSSSGLLSRQ